MKAFLKNMLVIARRDFVAERALPEDEFFADSFTSIFISSPFSPFYLFF